MGNTDGPDKPATLDYRSPESPQYVLLATMPLSEAELARLKLESEGIHCLIAGQHITTMHPLLFHSVELMVNPIDLPHARQILDSPADDTMEGEYVDEPWRCPKCHRKGLEMLPAAGLRKAAWRIWWAIAALIAIDFAMSWLNSGNARAQQSWNATADWALMPMLIAFGSISLYLVIGHREKRCPKCAWRSTEAAVEQ